MRARLRVLLVHDYGTPTGGAELQMLALRDGLRRAGHDVRLFTSRASLVPGELLADDHCFGTTIGKLQVVTQTANPSAVRRLRAVLKSYRPDVVHLRMFLAQLSPLVLALLRDVPTVYQAVWYKAICPVGTKLLPDDTACQEPAGLACLRHRCVTPQSWALHMAQLALVRRWWSSIDAVVGLSTVVRERLEAAGLGPVEVVPNGVAMRPARHPLVDPPTIVFAGRLAREKGADVLVRALPDVLRAVPDTRLEIAGHGPERQELVKLANALGIGHRIALPGHLPHSELERRFESAWVQAVPSLWDEPFGNVVTEAMMRGTAVVASRVGGPAETVRDGETGILVTPGDAGALADALVRLLSAREEAERLGEAGRRIAVECYSEADVVARFEEIYRRVVDARAAREP